MSEVEDTPQVHDDVPRTYSGAFLAVLAVSLLAAVGGLIWCYTLGGRVATEQQELTDARQDNVKLAAELRETDARLRVATDELGKSLGLTQKQLDARATAILQREQADSQRLQAAQQQTSQQVSAVASDVSSVKTDVGGVKTDLTHTQSDLATAVTQLQSIRGDLSSTNSVIARNHDELVLLEHKGDRNFYEFSLNKGQRKPVGTVSLELKKVDTKKNTYTLVVYSDDKAVQKKDRGLDEPLQFYSGKDPQLFEVVVNTIKSKNEVAGYLSSPKSAPIPPTAPPSGQ